MKSALIFRSVILVALLSSGCALRTRTDAPATSNSIDRYAEAARPGGRYEPPVDNRLHPRGLDLSKAPTKVAFGSCANQDAPQPIWTAMLAAQPDLYLAMGDNIYSSHPSQRPIADQYRKQDRIPEYRAFREQVPFMATWDDHDFGTADGGADAPSKAQARRDFLEYFSYVKHTMPIGRDGIYHAKMLGGQVTGRGRRRVRGPIMQVIMLDTRSFRSPPARVDNPETPLRKFEPTKDKSTTILGEAQWDWLEQELRKPAQLRVIVSSIQLIATEHGFEKWANFPHERERFFQLLRKTGARNVIVFSGDRHMGSIAKTMIPGWGVLYDVTASSLNRPSNLEEKDKDYLAPAYPNENFGLMSVDWPRKRALVELRDVNGKVLQEVSVPLK